MSEAPKKKRGFANLSPERQREIASLGGKAAHQRGTAHQWTPAEAMAAGRKGGIAVAIKKSEAKRGSTEIEADGPSES